MSPGQIHVFERYGDDNWQQNESLPSDLVRKARSMSSAFVVFVDTSTPAKDAGLYTMLEQDFSIPHHFWDPLHLETNGSFFALSPPNHPANDKHERTYVTCFRFLSKHANEAFSIAFSLPDNQSVKSADISYRWDKLGFCTWWQPDGSSVLFCFDTPHLTREQIQQSLLSGNAKIRTTSPFLMHSFLLPFIVRNFDHAVWSCRDLVRSLEKDRPSIQRPHSDFVQMHEIARHTLHSTEVIATALIVVEGMLEELEEHWANAPTTAIAVELQRELQFHRATLRCRKLRSQALEDRLKNEINLAFHIGSQHNSIVSSQIAEATQKDSTAMKTISVLGLIFLPGTLSSSIFGMTFFNFDRSGSSEASDAYVSDKFWVYWAVTAPITIAVFIAWFVWQSYNSRKFKRAQITV